MNRQNSTMSMGWKKEPWEREKRAGKDSFKEYPGQGTRTRIPKSSEYSRDQSVGTTGDSGSPSSDTSQEKTEYQPQSAYADATEGAPELSGAEAVSQYEAARKALVQDTMPSYAAAPGVFQPAAEYSPVGSSYAAASGALQSRGEKERWKRIRELGKASEELPLPSIGERAGLTLSGAGKQYAGSMAQVGKTILFPSYAGIDERIDRLAGNEKEQEKLHGMVDETRSRTNGYAEKMQDFADRMSGSGAQDIARAQEGLDPMGRMLVNAGVGVTQMAGDAALAFATGGSSMLPMVTRSFGGGVQEARAKGYNENQQMLLGLTNAATEYFSERLFGGNPVYDTDVGLVNRLVGKLVKNPKVMEVLASAPVEALNEGLEEIVSDLLNPVAEWAITGTRPEYELDQIIEDGAVGILTALIAQGGTKALNQVGQGLKNQGRVYDGQAFQGQKAASTPEAGPMTSFVDDATADQMLLERTTVDFLTRKGELKLTKGMTQEEKRSAVRQAVENVVYKEKTASTGETGKPRITMAEFTDPAAPIWTRVEYGDTETQTKITQSVHQEMVDAGRVVQIGQETRNKVAQSYPDLRSMKKAERLPILRRKMTELKDSLRSFLNGFKETDIEFEVKGKILEARLYDTGIREVLEKVTQDKASMLYESGKVFQNAQYLYSTPDYDGDPNVYRWNYFYTPVQIGDDVVGVRIAVRDMVWQPGSKGGSQIYNWNIKRHHRGR